MASTGLAFSSSRLTIGAALLLLALSLSLACGETRRGLGAECLRDEDCLSGVCSSRSCAGPPTLKVPPEKSTGDDDDGAEEPSPVADSGASDAGSR